MFFCDFNYSGINRYFYFGWFVATYICIYIFLYSKSSLILILVMSMKNTFQSVIHQPNLFTFPARVSQLPLSQNSLNFFYFSHSFSTHLCIQHAFCLLQVVAISLASASSRYFLLLLLLWLSRNIQFVKLLN